MPRWPQVLTEGGPYHVYSRCARGDPAFADPWEAIEIVELSRVVTKRDGLTAFV